MPTSKIFIFIIIVIVKIIATVISIILIIKIDSTVLYAVCHEVIRLMLIILPNIDYDRYTNEDFAINLTIKFILPVVHDFW